MYHKSWAAFKTNQFEEKKRVAIGDCFNRPRAIDNLAAAYSASFGAAHGFYIKNKQSMKWKTITETGLKSTLGLYFLNIKKKNKKNKTFYF